MIEKRLSERGREGGGGREDELRKPNIHHPAFPALVLEQIPVSTGLLQHVGMEIIDLVVALRESFKVADPSRHERDCTRVVTGEGGVCDVGEGVFVEGEGEGDGADCEVETAL